MDQAPNESLSIYRKRKKGNCLALLITAFIISRSCHVCLQGSFSYRTCIAHNTLCFPTHHGKAKATPNRIRDIFFFHKGRERERESCGDTDNSVKTYHFDAASLFFSSAVHITAGLLADPTSMLSQTSLLPPRHTSLSPSPLRSIPYKYFSITP